MKVDAKTIKQLRQAKNWSQDQLAQIAGLNLRTIQRMENLGNGSLESLRALAAVFEIDAESLKANDAIDADDENSSESKELLDKTPLKSIQHTFIKFSDFSGTATRYEFWWFFALFVLIAAIFEAIHPKASVIVTLIFLLPLAAVGTRRFNEAGFNPWVQLLMLVPFGQIPVLIMYGMESKAKPEQSDHLNA